jgi:hypothetical protein
LSLVAATTKTPSKKGPKKTPTTNVEGIYEAGERDVSQMCQLRLLALEQSRGMPHIDNGASMLMVAATAGAPLGVAPVAGVSNWVQLGPTAIPKGQTYSSARVLVTGRITSIVVDPTAKHNLLRSRAGWGLEIDQWRS